jgi:hypothetical protein
MRITATDIDEEARRLVENAYGQSVEIESRRVVVANFTLSTKGRAYMEAAMDWWLQYRKADDLAEWARLAGGDVAAEVFEDPFGQVAYLVLRKPT